MLTSAGQAQQLVLAVSADLPELSTLLAGVTADTTVLLVSTDADLLELLHCSRAAAPPPARQWRLAVVAHGSPGRVAIGREGLSPASVQARAQEWCALAPAAIDLYSCHTGADPRLASALSSACGAPVHTSSGVVGHACVGGSWALQAAQQAPAAANAVVPFSRAALAAWEFGLADFYYSTSGTGDGTSIGSASTSTSDVRTNLITPGNTVIVVSGSGALDVPLQNGDNISGSSIVLNPGTSYTLALDSGASVTMTAAQHNAATSISGSGSETITLTTAGTVTGAAAVETYILAAGSQQFNVGAANQQVNATAMTDGQTLTLTGNQAVTVTSTDADIDASAYAGAITATVNNDAAAATFEIGTSSTALTADGTNTLTIDGTGGGTLTIDGANTNTGAIAVTAATGNVTLANTFAGTGAFSVTTADASLTIALGTSTSSASTTVNATAAAADKTVTLTGSDAVTVTSANADIDASAYAGAITATVNNDAAAATFE
ncbi:MAG: DUF4347 domain-containing protein, partial [Chitinophagaceae bacterium]|nr:DUF4347 domain-containing protein [Chitinophagaceae bacterium]